MFERLGQLAFAIDLVPFSPIILSSSNRYNLK